MKEIFRICCAQPELTQKACFLLVYNAKISRLHSQNMKPVNLRTRALILPSCWTSLIPGLALASSTSRMHSTLSGSSSHKFLFSSLKKVKCKLYLYKLFLRKSTAPKSIKFNLYMIDSVYRRNGSCKGGKDEEIQICCILAETILNLNNLNLKVLVFVEGGERANIPYSYIKCT